MKKPTDIPHLSARLEKIVRDSLGGSLIGNTDTLRQISETLHLALFKEFKISEFRQLEGAGDSRLTLGRLISFLEHGLAEKAINEDARVLLDVPLDVGVFTSYRGYYEELALTFTNEHRPGPNALSFLNLCRAALGATFEGYKGGEYVMTRETPIWLAEWGDTSSTVLSDVSAPDPRTVVLHTAWVDS